MNTQYSKKIKKEVLTLRAKGLTYRKIAQKVKITVPTIGVWVRAAIKENPRLKTKLSQRTRIT